MKRNEALVIHKSDPTCLARYKAERIDGTQSDNEAAKIGTACARACEALAYVGEDEIDNEAKMKIAREAIEASALASNLSSDGRRKANEIMERALSPSSRLRFGRPSGWSSSAEWRWALDRDFRPLNDPDDPRAVAAGTCDLVEWDEAGGNVRVTDDKTTLHFQSADDLLFAWEPRVYALAALQVFGVNVITFRWRNLRHGYAVRAEYRRSDPWFEQTKARILDLRAEREVAVEMGAWTPTMGPDCGFCPIKLKCPAIAEAAAQGRAIAPALEPGEIARRAMGFRALASAYETAAEAVIEETQAPIDIGHGLSWGMKPVTKWTMGIRYEGDGWYDRLMRDLRDLGMTPAQEVEWFRFVPAHNVPGAVKTALHALCESHAKKAIESGDYVEPMTRFENSAWIAETRKRAPRATMDEILDALDFGTN